MAYTLEAFLAGGALATDLAARLGAVAVPLDQGIALVPVPEPVPDADQLAAGLSAGGAIAYVEAEYFGGVGEQHAVLWRGGEATDLDGDPEPVNAALRALGVHRAGGDDEFDTVGLGRHRATADWLTGTPR